MRLKILNLGRNILTFFIFSSIFLTFFLSFSFIQNQELIANNSNYIVFGISCIISVCLEFILFWIGIIMVYSTSIQLGFKTRILGIICVWIPIVNLCMLWKIIKICKREYVFEKQKIEKDLRRKEEKICETKYPILLVHGVFFRDFEHLNYWGRIPEELVQLFFMEIIIVLQQ